MKTGTLTEIASQRIGVENNPVRVWMASWHHRGNLFATCGDDKAIRLWTFNPDSDEKLENRTVLDDSHTRTVRCVNFSHCGRFLASASFDSTIVIYENDNGDYTEVNKLEGHESEVKWCAFSPSDEFFATCSRDKSVWFWQMDEDDDFNVSSILQPHTQDVKFVAWHPSEELLVSCSYDSSIRFFKYDGEDWITQQKIENIHEGTVWSAAFDANGHKLVTVGEDRTIQVFARSDPTKSALTNTWTSVAKLTIQSRWPLYSVSWNQNTGLIATAGGDSKIRIFRLENDSNIEELGSFKIHEQEVNCVAWCPSEAHSDVIVSTSDDGFVKVSSFRL